MDIAAVQSFLLWCALLNMGILIFWWGMMAFAHQWVYRMHSQWFKVTEERFNAIHYAGMMALKIATFFFYIIPYFALKQVT